MHPISDRPITDHDRCHDHIDMGEREFEYRLTTNIENIDAEAEIYNQPVYALSFFPSGAGEKKDTLIEIKNKEIIMSGCKKTADKRLLVRLFNSLDKKNQTVLKIGDSSFTIDFEPFEIKTYVVDDGKIQECDILGF